ncbi:MAG: SRPBCC family protein [Bacteroidetes bacterium]|nr:SRPBCC family protein [Bacteroidota bacterium]
MSYITVSESEIIHAPSDLVYRILADYHEGHQAIVPRKYFKEVTVTNGGFGEGTEIDLVMVIMGRTRYASMRVSEPEPGSVIVEETSDGTMRTVFTLENLRDGLTRVTISTKFTKSPGLKGWIEERTIPGVCSKIYREELNNLNNYAKDRSAASHIPLFA